MLDDRKIPDLLELIDRNSIRVYQPTSVIFVCGGAVDIKSIAPLSLRDAFMRIVHSPPFNAHNALLAEDLNAFFPKGNYRDLLNFEAEIAQVSSLLIVFSESFGSAAELGAFSMVSEIAERLLIIIDDKHYSDNSFIKLGPVRAMENRDHSSVCVLHRKDMNIASINAIANLNVAEFSRQVATAVKLRITNTKPHSTFNKAVPGHIIKLIVGLIQHFSALTFHEVDVCLYCMEISISSETLTNYLLCAEFAGWIKKEKRGVNDYYISVTDNAAMQYRLLASTRPIDRLRWRADIVAYWRLTDTARFNSIIAART